jgi:hypothetical protein
MRRTVSHANAMSNRGGRHHLRRPVEETKEIPMLNLLWAIAVILLVMWILGFALNFTLGGLLHVLLVLAIISVLVRIIMGRRIA